MQTYIKSAWATILNYFLKNNVLKNPTLILPSGGPVNPTLNFSEVRQGKYDKSNNKNIPTRIQQITPPPQYPED